MSRSHSDTTTVLLKNMSPSDAKISVSSSAELNDIRESEIRKCISIMEKYIRRFNFCLWLARLIEFGGLAYATKILIEQYGPYSVPSENRENDLHHAEYNAAVAERAASLPHIHEAFVNASCHTRTFEDWWYDGRDKIHYFTNYYGHKQEKGISEDKPCPLATRYYGYTLDDEPPEICNHLIDVFCIRPVLASAANYVSQRAGYVFALIASVGGIATEVLNIICNDLLGAVPCWPTNFFIPFGCIDNPLISTVAENYGIKVEQCDMRKTLQNFREAQDPRFVLACIGHSPASPLQVLLTRVPQEKSRMQRMGLKSKTYEHYHSGYNVGLFKQIAELAGFINPPAKKETQTETVVTSGPPRDRASMHRVIM
jgi:hypothetical protein